MYIIMYVWSVAFSPGSLCVMYVRIFVCTCMYIRREQDLPSGVGRENSTSSLLRYTPPLTLPEARHIHHSFPSRNKPKRNKAGRLLAIGMVDSW